MDFLGGSNLCIQWVGYFTFWYKSAADVFYSSLTVRERLVKPYLCARLKDNIIITSSDVNQTFFMTRAALFMQHIKCFKVTRYMILMCNAHNAVNLYQLQQSKVSKNISVSVTVLSTCSYVTAFRKKTTSQPLQCMTMYSEYIFAS